ncbi:hypothetical protein D3C80_2209080 [compost metagenome]
MELGVFGALHVFLDEQAACRWGHRVVTAGDDQQRRLDLTQLITEVGIAYRTTVGRIALR